MPIYEYACTSCGERTEAKQSFDDPPLEDCPRCGGRLRRLYSPVGGVFKGSGFYSTDQKRVSGDAKEAKPKEPAATEKKDAKADTSSKTKEKTA